MLKNRTVLALFLGIFGVSTASEPAGAANPSGEPAPTGDLPGWRLLFSDEFNGNRLGEWEAYSGRPGGAPNAQWDPSHCVVKNGVLEMQTYKNRKYPGKWTSCGVWNTAVSQTYGKYLVRFRCEEGEGIACIGLLWPTRAGWPPEIDFFEDAGEPGRKRMKATLHYDPDDKMIGKHVSGDFTKWNTMGVEWSPRRLRYTINGRVWGEVVHSKVPNVPHNLVLQTQMWDPTPRTPARQVMYVDWVAVYGRSK